MKKFILLLTSLALLPILHPLQAQAIDQLRKVGEGYFVRPNVSLLTTLTDSSWGEQGAWLYGAGIQVGGQHFIYGEDYSMLNAGLGLDTFWVDSGSSAGSFISAAPMIHFCFRRFFTEFAYGPAFALDSQQENDRTLMTALGIEIPYLHSWRDSFSMELAVRYRNYLFQNVEMLELNLAFHKGFDLN